MRIRPRRSRTRTRRQPAWPPSRCHAPSRRSSVDRPALLIHCAAMNSVGVGLIGAGPWGLTLARAFDRSAGARLLWICDLDAERRAQAAAAHPRARCTADVDDVLDDKDVAAVAVAV